MAQKAVQKSFLNFSFEEELTVSCFLAVHHGKLGMRGFKITPFGMITVSLLMRIVNVFVVTAI